LRKWGGELATDTRAELRAAGRAILILIDEIERLQVDARRARGEANSPLLDASTREAEQDPVDAESSQSLGASLRERLGAALPGRATFDRGE
jgi:hypothetical protein